MKLTPRKAEVVEIVALLESEDFGTAEDLAKAILKRSGELFAERDWFAHIRKLDGDLVLAWGPFSSENEAEKFGKKITVSGPVLDLKLYSSAALLQRVAEGIEGAPTYCGNCTHPIGTHRHEKRLGKCQVDRCYCTDLDPK